MTEQCGENMYKEGICSCGCGCGSKIYVHSDSEGVCNCSEKFLKIADKAWEEVLTEKIKAKIIETKGDHLDKLAELIATANSEKWKNKISAKIKCNKFKDNLKDFFSSCD